MYDYMYRCIVSTGSSAQSRLFPNSSSAVQPSASSSARANANGYSDDFEALVLSRMRAAAAATRSTTNPAATEQHTATALAQSDIGAHIDLTAPDAEPNHAAESEPKPGAGNERSADSRATPRKVIVLD